MVVRCGGMVVVPKAMWRVGCDVHDIDLRCLVQEAAWHQKSTTSARRRRVHQQGRADSQLDCGAAPLRNESARAMACFDWD